MHVIKLTNALINLGHVKKSKRQMKTVREGNQVSYEPFARSYATKNSTDALNKTKLCLYTSGFVVPRTLKRMLSQGQTLVFFLTNMITARENNYNLSNT